MTELHSCASELRSRCCLYWHSGSGIPVRYQSIVVPTGSPYSGTRLVTAFLFILVSDWPDAGQSGILAFKKHSTMFAVNLFVSLETNTVRLQKNPWFDGAKSASSRIEIHESLSEEIREFWLTEGSVLYNCVEENPSIHYIFLYGGIYCDFRHPTWDYG